MDLILKQDVEHLGYQDDMVTVKPGYGRNYLIPRGMAVMATPGAKKMMTETLKQRRHKEENEIKEAEKMAKEIQEMEIQITAKTGKGNKLFGSITNANLADELSRAGHHVDRKYIQIQGGAVKATGPYVAHIRLHREVQFDIDFEVVGESGQ